MDAPEVRLSPDGSIAIKWPRRKYWESRHAPGCYPVDLIDEDVSDWTPLLPVSNKDGES